MFNLENPPTTQQPEVNARPLRIANRQQSVARQSSKFANKKVIHEQRIIEHYSHREAYALAV
jgi:hypothetical protein